MFTSVGFCGLKCIHIVVQPLSPPFYRSLHFWWPVYIYKRCLGVWRLLCEVRNVDGFRSPVLSVMGMLLSVGGAWAIIALGRVQRSCVRRDHQQVFSDVRGPICMPFFPSCLFGFDCSTGLGEMQLESWL